MTDLSSRIRAAAKRKGGLNWLSKAIGVPRRTLGNWLTGTSPKPLALKKIAEVTEVSLDWLLTGDGYPDEDGFSVALKRVERERLAREEREAKGDAEFHEGFSKALERVERERLATEEREAKEDAEFHDGLSKALERIVKHATSPRTAPDTSDIRRRIVSGIKKAHKEAKITLHPDDVALIGMEMFATLTQRVRDFSDAYEVDFALSHLMHNLMRELEDARNEPGSGKHSA